MSDGFVPERSVMSDSFSCLRRLTCLVEVLMSDKVDMSGRGDKKQPEHDRVKHLPM